MAKFATAYIELRPDLSNFGTGLAKEIEARLGDADVNESVDRSFRPKFSGVGEGLSKAIGTHLAGVNEEIDRTVRPKFSGVGDSLAEVVREQVGPELERAVGHAVEVLERVPGRGVAQVSLEIRQAEAELTRLRAQLAQTDRERPTPEVDLKIGKAEAELTRLRAQLAGVNRQRSSPKVDVEIGKAEAEVARLRADLAALGQEKSTPTVKADIKAARVNLKEVGARLAELRAEKAEVKVSADPSSLQRRIEEIRVQLARLRSEKADVKVDADTSGVQRRIDELRVQLADLRAAKATVKVDADTSEAKRHIEELQVRLARLRAEKAEIKVDVDRSFFSNFSGLVGTLGTALHGIAISLGGLLGIGGALTGLGQAAAAAAPLVVALAVGVGVLVASFGAAVAGAGALGIALAGALGPAAIVAFTALAKIAQVIKAIHTDSTKSAASTDAVAAAQDQLASSTDAVASAQANLKDQTVAAYRAWADSIEAVKDDLLAVQDAKLGIADASLSLREAKQALKEFKAEAPGLSGVFKKFTDVNVDMSGLKAALDAARKAGGNKLSTDDELKLERLILNVRRAKLGEKEATDRLHDANVKLQRDRQDEANYLAHGINAYPGYTSAVRGLAQANRSLAAAQRASATATAAQAGALAKLSPIQQRLATTFKLVSTGFNKALAPAMDALFSGLNRGLRIFLGVLSDPKIARALQEVGAAMGSVLVSMAKFFASKGARESFVALSRGAAQLIRVLGNKAFPAFFKILTAIAVASMPQLLKLANSIADTLDRWATWIDKHPKEFRDHLKKLIDTTFKWLAVLVEVGGFLLKLGGFFNGVGATIGRAFQGGKQAVSDFFANFGIHNDTLKALGDAFGALGKAAEYLWQKALPPLKGILSSVGQAFNGLVELVSGIVQGDWKKAWTGAKDIVVGALRNALNFIRLMLSPFSDIGKKLGKAFTSAFRTAVNAVKTVIRGIRDFFVSIISWVIDKVNELNVKIPKKVLGVPVPFVGGHHVGIHIDNPFADQSKPNLNPKHLPTLTKSPRGLRAATSSDQQPTIVKQFGDIVLPAPPAAAVPDARAAAVLFAREIQKR